MKKIIILFLCIILNGCISRSKTTNFYGLKNVIFENKVKFNDFNKKILVNNVSIPNYMDKPQIITLSKDYIKYNISEINRWIEPLNILIQNTLISDMSYYLNNSIIKEYNLNERDYNYLVNINIRKINNILDKELYFECFYTIINNKGKIIINDKFIDKLYISNNFIDLADKQSEIIGKLAYEIVKNIYKINNK